MEAERTWCPNTLITPSRHFYVSPQAWNKKELEKPMFDRKWPCLIAPSQTGKTTRVTESCERLHGTTYDNRTLLAILIDIRTVVSKSKREQITFYDAFEASLIEKCKDKNTDLEMTHLALPDFFRLETWANFLLILFLDDIDSLSALPVEVRCAFLGQLGACKHDRKSSLLSCVAITNCVGPELIDTVGNSPFNAGSPLNVPYFSPKEHQQLYYQYFDQLEITVGDNEKRILKDIYNNSSGAPGLEQMYGIFLAKLYQKMERLPSYSEWLQLTTCHKIFAHFQDYANFQKITFPFGDKADPEGKNREGIVNFIYGKDPPLDQKRLFLRFNILRNTELGLQWASPLIRRYVIYNITPTPNSFKLPLGSTGKINVPRLVAEVVRRMDPLQILSAEKMSSNSFCSSAPLSANESTYRMEFLRCLHFVQGYQLRVEHEIAVTTKALKDYTGWTPACPAPRRSKSLDSLVEVVGLGKIAIEHCTNVNIDPTYTQSRGSLGYHVFFQAEPYHYALRPSQTWVLHWTTVKNGFVDQHGAVVEYHFPSATNVETIYVYHDELFTHAQVVTKDRTTDIRMPLPSFSMKRKRDTDQQGSSKKRLKGTGYAMMTEGMGDAMMTEGISQAEYQLGNDVIALLEEASCEQYISKFVEEEVELSDLTNLSEAELQADFQMKKYPAKRLYNKLQQLKNSNN
eukprot:CAMPEP_0174250832 /NCGR_PEP_ID=MMETSP0439-20130205/872_1 /TAXON_ID=0 /ORGANISM="Stereomyxa ramosa, Strain Chinc5" /LENGTH=685 /DNA_ID=CAMNT_0015330999 /DNA_START=44 /DNA_END=2101 /DNA_ORIENTATION=-